jgi:hypothetical protein
MINARTFNEWYSKLPADTQGNAREEIMKALDIKAAMFYHLKNGLRKLSPAEKNAINTIAKEQLIFPDDEDYTINTNLVRA